MSMPYPLTAALRRGSVAFGLALLLGSCAALPPMPPRTASQAFDAPQNTPLGARVAAERATPGHSGWRLLVSGEDALATLIGLTDSAQRALDLQYYAVLNDASTRVLLQRVRAAADRGVRVRLLIDDLNTSGADDALLRLTRHPRIEVRLYNPLPSGRMSVVTKVLGSLHDAQRINSRMHNKAFIADGALAVTGGRNLGDPYFIQTAEANFVDLDVLIAGPVVRQLSSTFDRFWNSELAYPVEAIVPAAAALAAPRQTPDAPASAASAPLDAPAQLPAPAQTEVERALAAWRTALRLHWSPTRLIADRPSKSLAQGAPDAGETMFDDLGALLRSAEREVLIVTPYFVPGVEGMALVRELRGRGVRVRVLTASLAATDAPVVHIGYSRYREALLDAGVELYELHPSFSATPPRASGVHSRTNLHAKAVIVDRRTILVGSMNLDPRSDKLNTEMGLLTKSAPLADQLLRLLDAACERGAYHVTKAEDGSLRWRFTARDGRPVETKSEPEVSFAKRFAFKLLSPFAPERML